jgi:hypothetical protein
MGAMFSNIVRGERPENWPIAVSRKKIGIPTKNSKMKNGIKKGPPPHLKTK